MILTFQYLFDNVGLSNNIILTPKYNSLLNSISLIQTIEPVKRSTNLFSSLDLKSKLSGPTPQPLNSNLLFYSTMDSVRPIYCTLSNNLSFGSNIHKANRIDIYDLLYFRQFINPNTLQSKLTLTQTLSVIKNKPIKSTLSFHQIFNFKFIESGSLLNTLTFQNYIVGYKENSKFINTDLPSETKRNYIELIYSTTTLILRNPEFDDKDSNEQLRIQRKSRGGDLIIFRDNAWPKIETLKYTFKLLKQEDAIKLLNFFQISLGKSITLIDHYTRTWTGIISNPTSTVKQETRYNYNIEFDFQGVLV